MGEIAFDVTTPAATAELPVFEQLVLSDGAQTLWPGQPRAHRGARHADSASGDSDDQNDQYDQDVSAGCNAGGSSGLGGLAIALGAVLRRRRR